MSADGPFEHAPDDPTPVNGFRRVSPYLPDASDGHVTGRLLVTPGVVAWIAAGGTRTGTTTFEHVRQNGVGRALVESTAELIGSSDSPSVSSLVLIAGDSDGLHVLAHGPISIEVIDAGHVHTSVRADSADPMVRTFTNATSMDLGVRQVTALDRTADLRDGEISASGASVAWHHAARSPLQPFGLLRFDTGEVFRITDPVTVGRAPTDDPLVHRGGRRALRPAGDVDALSRIHASLAHDGECVLLTDRGSLNGTFIWARDQQAWTRIVPGQPTRLRDCDMIGFGRRVATLEMRQG